LCGVCCVVYAVWCILCGVCCVVYAVWCMLCGVYCVVYTVWCMLCGVCCVVYIERNWANFLNSKEMNNLLILKYQITKGNME